MKKSDVDTIVQGLAPALLAFVSQKLAPVSERLNGVAIQQEALMERDANDPFAKPEPAPAIAPPADEPEPEPEPDQALALIAEITKRFTEAA